MAERLVIQIDGDSSGLTKALASTETRLNSLNTRISNTSRSLTNINKKFSEFGSTMQAMGAAQLRMAANLSRFATKLESTTQLMGRHNAATRQATKQSNAFHSSLGNISRQISILNTLSLASTGIFGGLIKTFIDANSKMEKMGVLLKNTALAGDEAGKALEADESAKYLWDLADNAPFQIDALTKTFVKLKAAGIDPTQGSMKALVDTVAYFGGGTDEMNRAGVALSQMLSKGKVTAEELRQQLGDAIPNAMKDMATALDMTIPQLDKKMRDGLVLSGEAVPKLIALWQEKYAGGAASMMTTWDGVMARMSNQWQKMIVRVTDASGENSLFVTLKKQAEDFTNFLNSKAGDEFFKNLQDGLATIVNGLAEATKFIYKYREELILAAKAMAALWVGKNIGGMIGSNISRLKDFVTWIQTMSGATTVATSRFALMGQGLLNLVQAIGGFNSSTKLTIGNLALIAARFGLVGIAIGAALLGINSMMQSNQDLRDSLDRTNAAQEHNSKLLDEVAQLSKHGADATATLSNETDKAADKMFRFAGATGEAAKKLYELADARRNDLLKELSVEAVRADTEYKAQYKQSAQGVRETIKSGSFGDTVRAAARGTMSRLGIGPTEAEVQEGMRRAAAQRDAAREGIHKLQFETPLEWGVRPSDRVSPVNTGAGADAGGSGKKDREAEKRENELERLRNKWVQIALARKQYEYELDHGNTEDFETDEITKELEAQAKLISSKEILTTKINDEKDARRAARQDLADNDVVTDLASRTKEAANELEGVNQQITDGYMSLNNTFERIAKSIREKYGPALKAANKDNVAGIEASIDAAIKKEQEVEAAKVGLDYKEKSRELDEALMTEDELRQSNYEREKARIQDMITVLSDQNGCFGETNAILEEYLKKLARARALDNPFAKWALSARDLKANVGDALVGSMDGFIDSLAEGKMNFKEFATSLLKDLTKIIIRAMIAKAILSALGLGGTVSSAPMNTNFQTYGSAFDVPLNHTGGIAGKESSDSRSVDARMFKFAKRYHTGGFPGLRSDEVPIIAQKGEGVFTKEQMKALGSSQGGAGVAPQVNIINQTSTPVDQESTQPRFDGEKYVVDILLKHASRPGPVRDMLGAKR